MGVASLTPPVTTNCASSLASYDTSRELVSWWMWFVSSWYNREMLLWCVVRFTGTPIFYPYFCLRGQPWRGGVLGVQHAWQNLWCHSRELKKIQPNYSARSRPSTKYMWNQFRCQLKHAPNLTWDLETAKRNPPKPWKITFQTSFGDPVWIF